MRDGIQMFGTVKASERGQIVIPKGARGIFGIGSGDSFAVLGNERMNELALIKADTMKGFARKMLDGLGAMG